jgi:regulator of sirC expression with transglutaminase-like and TPR domain
VTEIDQTTFAAECRTAGEAISPVRAGLLFARECAYPELRPSDYLIQVQALAEAAGRALDPRASFHTRGLALAQFLAQDAGFRGNNSDYGDPRNAYLNQVLDRRLGLPISLSVIFLEIGRRLRLPVAGVGLPGHFIVRVGGPEGPLYLDPFNGGRRVTLADCRALVQSSTGLHQASFDPEWLEPTPPRDIVARMLNNLRGFYVSVEDWALAVTILEHLRTLQPEESRHLRDLGLLHYRLGRFRRAAALLNQYLAREPNAPDVESVRQGRDTLLEELARLN